MFLQITGKRQRDREKVGKNNMYSGYNIIYIDIREES